MLSLLGKLISLIILPGVLLVQIIRNIFDKRYRHPLYHFKAQCIHKRIGKYESDYVKIQRHKSLEEAALLHAQKHKTKGTAHESTHETSHLDRTEDSSKNAPAEGTDITIVLIPGNPGYVRFYDVFLHELATKLQFVHNVYSICHAGHLGLPIWKRPHAGQGDNPFGWTDNVLSEQIEHKAAFLEYVMKKHPGTQIVLVGHSIGAYIALQLMDRFPILHSYLLFPTIEKMNDVPNYSHANFFTRFPNRWFLAAASELLRIIPGAIKRVILHMYLQSDDEEEEPLEDQVESILQFLDFTTILNLSRMAQSEFTQVRKRPDDLITKYGQDITFYYGRTDKWTPLALFDKLKKDFPNLDAKLDDHGLHHAFVIGGARQMASILSKWIGDLKDKKQLHQQK